jgi:adenosylhomocysteine nucleosidase
LTVDRLIATPEDKRRLGQQHGAIAVEMEAAYFAARCTRAEIPFACVRATSDELATPISRDIMELLEDGVLSPWRVLGTLLRRPTLLRELLRLRRDTNHAARQLGIALGELLTLTLLS